MGVVYSYVVCPNEAFVWIQAIGVSGFLEVRGPVEDGDCDGVLYVGWMDGVTGRSRGH